MRDPTPDERELLEKRRKQFDRFLAERMPVIAEFFEAIGAAQPALAVADPESHLPLLEEFLGAQDLRSFDEQDRSFLRARLVYFIGELLIQRHGGHWLVHENPDSLQFARYVIGAFPRRDPNLTVDPAGAAEAYLAGDAGGFSDVVRAVERELLV